RNPPNPGRKLAVGPKILSSRKHPRKGLLLQILSSMRIAGHARAKPENWYLPTLYQLNKSRMIVLHLNSPHRLFICHSEQRRKVIASCHALSRLDVHLRHNIASSRSCHAILDRTAGLRVIRSLEAFRRRKDYKSLQPAPKTDCAEER